MALARAVLLPKDVAVLNEEASDMTGDLLVMRQGKVRIVTLVFFNKHF